MQIQCLGAGVMSSAFAHVQALKHDVHVYPTPYDTELCQEINTAKRDVRFTVGLPSRLKFSEELLSNPDLIVIGVSSLGIQWAIELCQKYQAEVPVILLTKGIIQHDDCLVSIAEYVQKKVNQPICALTGPCIAKDLANGSDTFVEISGDGDLSYLSQCLSVENMNVRPMHNIGSACWMAALKNVYAMVIGANSTTSNKRAFTVTMALLEMKQWLKDKGLDNNVDCLSGVGDLLVTAQHGRNGRFGSFVAQGLSREEVLNNHMLGETVEGLKVLDLLIQHEDISQYRLILAFLEQL